MNGAPTSKASSDIQGRSLATDLPNATGIKTYRSGLAVTEPPAIRFANVSQRYTARDRSSILALDRIDLTIPRKDFTVVVGPSGCGKSTLLRLVGGLLKPSAGQVEIFGSAVIEPRQEIGVVFQKPTLLPWLSVIDNVTFPIRHKFNRVSSAEVDQAAKLLDSVGLKEFARKVPGELSGGMQQRVSICRALMMDPDILLMDEPFSALDALTRDEMSFELLDLSASREKTVLFITHAISEAVLLADRIVLMSARPGCIREVIDVDLPRPRSMDTLRDPRFHDISEHLRYALFDRSRAAH
jgi:NitT/TauT family transport system ATP-binding protein